MWSHCKSWTSAENVLVLKNILQTERKWGNWGRRNGGCKKQLLYKRCRTESNLLYPLLHQNGNNPTWALPDSKGTEQKGERGKRRRKKKRRKRRAKRKNFPSKNKHTEPHECWCEQCSCPSNRADLPHLTCCRAYQHSIGLSRDCKSRCQQCTARQEWAPWHAINGMKLEHQPWFMEAGWFRVIHSL